MSDYTQRDWSSLCYTVNELVVDDVNRWREIRIINVGSHTITMKHNDSNSTNVYRFACSGGSDHSLVSAGIATCLYDPHSANWRVY